MSVAPLIGRGPQRAWLESAVATAAAGHGGLVLLTGEAGVGKTRLVEDVAGAASATFLRGAANPAAPPYSPIVTALRRFLQRTPNGLDACGPLRQHLALLLPELGEAVAASDRTTLFEAIRGGLVAVGRSGPAIVLLDDLQWSDEATLELLAALAAQLDGLPILVVGAYSSDEIARPHPLRRLRTELRRDRLLRELTLEPLSAAATAQLAEAVLGDRLAPGLGDRLHARTQGVPFFVEELAAALRAQSLLCEGGDGLALCAGVDVPLPETIRDAVLLRVSPLPPAARATAEAASVAGASFDLELLAELGYDDGLEAAIGSGLLVELEGGRGAFRHPLARDAVYEDMPWLSRRELHRAVAEALQRRAAPGAEVAAHWLAAREPGWALDALLAAVDELAALHAYRDAARAARSALELWPDGERGEERIGLLERQAHCAELAGELGDATRALREVAAARQAQPGRALAETERRLAGIYALQGDREHALTARRLAADAFSADALPGEAAAERLIAAGYLQSAGRHGEAAALAARAVEEAEQAGRTDLRARALGLRGVARVKAGELEAGLETVRTGLALALEHELTSEAAEVYQRLGTALEVSADYAGAQAALDTAVGLCQAGGADELEHTCLGCVAYVLRELGDWPGAEDISRDLVARGGGPGATLVADGVLGGIHAFRGEARQARPLLLRSLDVAARLDVLSMQVDSAACLAMLDAADGADEAAAERCRFVLARWQASEDHHYAVWGLRWAASFFARRGALRDARACAGALSTLAASAGYPDALAALAHALGEIALQEGDAPTAAAQMTRALELHAGLDIPFEHAQIQLRAGVAHAAAGDREAGLERLNDAYRAARRLGARPLAAEATAEVARLGESLERRLGRQAAANHDAAGLSRRELEVMRLVAVGRTNREIARDLYVSPRTVDMHVRNILGKLGCRTRTEATVRAHDLGLLPVGGG